MSVGAGLATRRRVREAGVPLSPFSARMALAAFLAIATGISANVLYFQEPEDRAVGEQTAVLRPRPMTDAERLEQLALRAVHGAPASDTSVPEKVGGGEAEAMLRTERVGSFAPSSGRSAFGSLPGVDPGEARRATIRSVQAELARRGYEPGPADGAAGLVTRAAVLAYEHDQGLLLTAEPSPEVLAHVRHGTSAPGAAIGLDASVPRNTGQAELLIRTVQQSLGRLGYLATPADGAISDETVRAIREFEMDSGLIPSGRISGPLMARLIRQTAGPAAH